MKASDIATEVISYTLFTRRRSALKKNEELKVYKAVIFKILNVGKGNSETITEKKKERRKGCMYYQKKNRL